MTRVRIFCTTYLSDGSSPKGRSIWNQAILGKKTKSWSQIFFSVKYTNEVPMRFHNPEYQHPVTSGFRVIGWTNFWIIPNLPTSIRHIFLFSNIIYFYYWGFHQSEWALKKCLTHLHQSQSQSLIFLPNLDECTWVYILKFQVLVYIHYTRHRQKNTQITKQKSNVKMKLVGSW